MKPTIAIAGATGFIGRWFIAAYSHKYHIIALSRSEMEPSAKEEVVWKKVDLYSVRSTTEAIRGADYALYLVHSMQPSTRLNQSHFEDTDLLLADNFSRAAEIVGLKQIVFMGGILPKDESKLSTHLRSRYEVEVTLGGRSAALTALRAGIIVGPGGSSFEIIEKLVSRLPVMLCPEWTRSETQPVALEDVLVIIDYCFGNTKAYGEAIEIGTPEKNTYMGMLQTTSKMLGKHRIIRSVPVFSLGLSKLWVAVFSDSSTTFVSPLIESLRHQMTVEEHPLIRALGLKYKTFEEAVEFTLENADEVPSLPKSRPGGQAKNTVRSVQRLANPGGLSAEWVARAYLTWLPDAFRYLIRVNEEEGLVSFLLFGMVVLKLQYATERSDEHRQVYYIVGGLLAGKGSYGWLEFRSVLEGRYIIGAIHEFVPRLPWYLYVNSQALLHLWVMKRFGKFLSRQDPKSS
ncbi:NAD(P)H-binding protein [Marinoscillum sp.]|uniref:NAD(P)H-binding protein n=1 Tax=Marinoscillum sp. TaxID=2024838 RepID=UPI003BAC5A60